MNADCVSNQSRPLRVAIIASSLALAGAEKQTYYIAKAFNKTGIDVRLFYLGAGGYYEQALRQAGVSVRQIYAPNQSWLMLTRLIAALCRLRPQIVLAAQFGDLLYAGPAGRFCQALTLGGVRSDGFYELNAHGRTSRWMMLLAHGLIANSYHAKRNLASSGIRPEKIAVLPNVIDLQEFDGRSILPAEISLPEDRIIISAVGSLHPCKRFDRFLDALALARRTEPALTGVIAGSDCGDKPNLEARAKALGLTPRDIIFLGEIENVAAFLARTAFLVLTSEYEGFPNVILEAMAARLPVISVPAGDSDTIVQHGKTGWIVEGDDSQRLAAFMVQLAQSAAMRKSFGGAGRKRVELEYNSESLAERLVAILQHFSGRQLRPVLRELVRRSAPQKAAEALRMRGGVPA